MKQFISCVIVFAIASIAVAQERNYYVEAERAFQRCEYAKAANLYKITYAMIGIDTSAKQKLSSECADAQENARAQKNAGNIEQAKVLFKKLLELNPNDAEATKFIQSAHVDSKAGEIPEPSDTIGQDSADKILKKAKEAYYRMDYSLSIKLFNKVNDNPLAQYFLGEMYNYGNGVEKDIDVANQWYRSAFNLFAQKKDDPFANYYMGEMYHSGIGVTVNYAKRNYHYRKAFDLFLKNADDAESQYFIGNIYYHRLLGGSEKLKEAFEWYLKSAEQGHPLSQIQVGTFYYYGFGGLERNKEEAYKWYLKSAEQDIPEAQYRIGRNYYCEGWVTRDDYEKAFHWYLKSAEKGHHLAALELGEMYENGWGVPKDYEKAALWYRKASEHGNNEAEYRLGKMYEEGRGVPRDYKEAVQWYRKSAHEYYSPAQERLKELGEEL